MKVCTCGVWASLGVDERRWLQERMQKSRAVCFKSGHMVGGRHCMLSVGILRSGRENGWKLPSFSLGGRGGDLPSEDPCVIP